MAEAAHCCPHGQDVHSQIAAIFRIFFVRGREGEFLRQGAGRGLLAEAAKGPLRLSDTSRSARPVRTLEGILRKAWFSQNSAARRRPSWPPAYPPDTPASPVEPERGRGGIARNFETPQITERVGLEKRLLDYPQSGFRRGEGPGEGNLKGIIPFGFPSPGRGHVILNLIGLQIAKTWCRGMPGKEAICRKVCTAGFLAR